MVAFEANPDRDIDRRAPEAVAASLRDAIEGATLLVGHGQYSPHAGHERTFIVSVDDENQHEPKVHWDRFFPKDALGPLCNALRAHAREVLQGELDAMYATAWGFAWTCPPAPLRLYDRTGPVVIVDSNILHLKRSDERVTIPTANVDHVEGWLSPDWVDRQVRIITRAGDHFVVAECKEWVVNIDPTYDGIDLMFDAAWVAQLGKAMARGLGVPYTSNDSALQ